MPGDIPPEVGAGRVRLAVLAAVVTAVPIVLAVLDVVSADQLREVVDRAGPLAPAAYVVVSAVLGALLLPGPLLAATSGLLFGAGTGTAVTVCSAVLTALICREIGLRAGRTGTRSLLGHRGERVDRALDQEGTKAVIVQRLVPGVPDAPLSYAFGALGLTARQIGVGTAVGTLPRAFSYTALGAAVDDPSSPLAAAGLIGLVLTALLGAELARRAWHRRAG